MPRSLTNEESSAIQERVQPDILTARAPDGVWSLTALPDAGEAALRAPTRVVGPRDVYRVMDWLFDAGLVVR